MISAPQKTTLGNPVLGFGLEEGKMVEGGGPLVHEDPAAGQLTLELCHPLGLLDGDSITYLYGSK